MNKNILKETMDAYSDSENGSKESRNLEFLASKPVSVDVAVGIMSKALMTPEQQCGYNAFFAGAIREIGNVLGRGTKVWLAREGSVCVYFKSKKMLPTVNDGWVKPPFENLGCVDEFSLENIRNQSSTNKFGVLDGEYVYRCWWD